MQKEKLLGLLALAAIIAGLFFFFKEGKPKEEAGVGGEEEAKIEKVTQELSQQLGVSVEEGVERVTLKDVLGGGASGLATRNFSEAGFKHTVLAALPDPGSGNYYDGWLVRGEEGDLDYSVMETGRLLRSKGGYLLEYSDNNNLLDYTKVWVTLESKDDGEPEVKVLEGSFNL